MGISADDVSNSPQFGISQLLANISKVGSDFSPSWKFKFPHHHPQMLCLSYGKTRISTVRKPSHIKVSGGIQVLPKMGDSSGIAGTQFYINGSSIKKFYPQTVADVRPGVSVTVPVKRSYLAFSSTSGFGEVGLLPRILGDPAITWHSQILSRKNFFVRILAINFGLAINTKTRVNIR